MVAILNFQSFCKTQKCLYLENRAIWSEINKILESLQSSHANFQNIFVSSNIADNFLQNTKMLISLLDRADCADFGCHNSMLETKHLLNTLALTFIAFSGRFVFAMQKHYLFFLRAIL